MRRAAILLCAASFAAAAGTAQADIQYTPMTGYTHGVGIYNPSDPTQLFSVYVTSGSGASYSDVFTFTFAMHHTNVFYDAQALYFSFAYDNDSLEVIGAQPMGQGVSGADWFYNYPSVWPNQSSGWQSVSLGQWFATSDYQQQNASAVVPFFQVQLHIKSACYSQVNSFGVNSMTLISHINSEWNLYGQDFVYGFGAIHEVPEPASMTLLFGGLAGLAGGAVRRRRRAT
jgi:hypothetical protein